MLAIEITMVKCFPANINRGLIVSLLLNRQTPTSIIRNCTKCYAGLGLNHCPYYYM